MWTVFWIGLALGAAVAVPVAWQWSRRTERRVRVLEQRARTAERLAELGTMTSGLAHEIKNPLSTIGLNVQLLHEDFDELAEALPPDKREHAGRVQRRFASLGRETDRLRAILEDFLRFAGRVQLDLQPEDLNRVVDELVDFFAPQAAQAKVNLRTQLTRDDVTVPADASLLKQAMLNLMINATQAMSRSRDNNEVHGGASELIVRTERGRELNQPVVRIHVIDTGPGVPDDLAEQVFQPYFSNKPGGTGLGLPTSRRIVEEHGGRLSLHSEPGRGTDFTITLPVG